MSDGYNRNNNPNQKPPNVLHEYALRLTGEPINGSKRPPSLMMNIKRDGKAGAWCVNLEARTGVEDDKDFGKIPFMIDMPTAFMILNLVQQAADNAEAGKEGDFTRIEISNRRYLRQQNAYSKEPMQDGTIAIGWTSPSPERQSGGQVYIGIKSWDTNRPNCKFVLKPVVDFRRAVKLFKRDGSAWEDGPLSQMYARAWASALAKLLTQVYVDEFTPPPPREQQGGSGGGNRGGGYGNSNNNSAGNSSGGWSESEDDIPM